MEEQNERPGLPGHPVGPDEEIEVMAQKYEAYKRIKLMFFKDVADYEMECLDFEQFILVHSPPPSAGWAYAMNRSSNGIKNGHHC